jgi:multiple sugar transport system substrate-binding protein
MNRKVGITIALLGMVVSLFTACANKIDKGNADAAIAVSTEPVTLSMFITIGGFPENDFQTIIAKPLKEKYPHITLNLLRPAKGANLPDRIVSGDVPDIILSAITSTNSYLEEMQLIEDLTPWVKKSRMDLKRFDSAIIKAIRDQGGDSKALYSIPFSQNSFALWYNKGLFDKFSVAYPTDGMTWEQAIALAKKMTRNDGNKPYRGLDIYNNNNIKVFASPLSLPLVNAKTNRAVISEKWGQVFRLAMDIYDIPGNRPAKFPGTPILDAFLKDQDLAMATNFSNAMIGNLAQAKSLNLEWDLVQPPSFKEKPNVRFQSDIQPFFITKTSKYKDQAFQVIDFLSSKEIQLIATKMGKPPVLADKSLRTQFAADIPYVQGKNVQALFKSTPAKIPPYSKYNDIVLNSINAAFQDVYSGKADINSALRQAEAAANEKISQDQ